MCMAGFCHRSRFSLIISCHHSFRHSGHRLETEHGSKASDRESFDSYWGYMGILEKKMDTTIMG